MGQKRVGDQLLFIGTLWVAIVTALLCALVPAGLPNNEARGSAFNPSNPVVALRARSHRDPSEPIVVARKDDTTPGADFNPFAAGPLAFFALLTFAALWKTLPQSVISARSCVRVPVISLGTICPRGPPLD